MEKYNEEEFYNPHYQQHDIELPSHFLVCGGTGQGKTNFIVNLLLLAQNTFAHLVIVCKDSSEKAYKMLQDQLGDRCRCCTMEELESLDEMVRKNLGQVLLVFDDFICDRQGKLESYIIRSRKYNICNMFLTQSFFETSKLIRANCKYIVLLQMPDDRNLGLILSKIGCPLDYSVVKKVVRNATKIKLSVCIINAFERDLNKKFRRNFKDYYTLVDEDDELLPVIKLYPDNPIIN